MDIDEKIQEIQNDIHSKECDEIIRAHKPFIKGTIAKKLGRYVEEYDDVFSIGLSAFLEAIVYYNVSKGHFYNFARLVIERRVISYILKSDNSIYENIDDYELLGTEQLLEEQVLIKEEIKAFEEILLSFGITLDDLISNAPKHKDTRNRAKHIALEVSRKQDLVDKLYKSKKLPVTIICKRLKTTRKIIYRCKQYITSIVIVHVETFDFIKKWI